MNMQRTTLTFYDNSIGPNSYYSFIGIHSFVGLF